MPVLALVWASLPVHQCNLAFAGTARAALPAAGSATIDAAKVVTELEPSGCHQVADPSQFAKSTVSCSDLGRVAPDLRPSLVVDTVLVHVSFDARWFEQGLRPVALSGTERSYDDGRWRIRPLHLQKSTLLI